MIKLKTKSIFPLFLLAGTLLTAACATPTAKQAGNNSFEWGQVQQTADLSWADSAGSRQIPGNKIILSANSFGAVADSTVLSTEAIQKAIDSCAVIGGGTVVFQPGYYQTGACSLKKRCQPAAGQRVTLLASPDIHHYPGIPFADSRNRDDMAGGSYPTLSMKRTLPSAEKERWTAGKSILG